MREHRAHPLMQQSWLCPSALAPFLAALLLAPATVAQTVPQFSVGFWRGTAFQATAGTPGGCVATSDFSDGNRLGVLISTDMSLGVIISKGDVLPDWVPAKASAPPRAWVDDEPEFAFSGTIMPFGLVLEVGSILDRPGASTFRRMGEGRALNVVVDGSRQRYALRGTYGALAELIGCAQKVRAGEVVFPAPASPPVAAIAPPPSPPRAAEVVQRPPAPPTEPRLTGSGSGVVVSESGHILTADHVIEDCKTLRVTQVGSSQIAAEVVGRDPRNDLALLKAASPLPTVVSLRIEALRNGEAVVAYGYPLGGLLASTGNVTFGNVSALVGLRDDSRMLQISAPVQPGNSGGPLLDMQGRLVGIVQSKLNAVNIAVASGDIPQNVNFAMKGSVALGFLQAHNIEPSFKELWGNLGDAVIRRRSVLAC